MNEHRDSTDVAREKVLCNALQLIVYTPPSTSNGTTSASEARVGEATDAPPSRVMDSDPDVMGLEAAKSGDLDILRALVRGKAGDIVSGQGGRVVLRKPWTPNEVYDRERHTPLTWAAGNGHLDVCKFLVDECDMNPSLLTGLRKKRRCSLHWAARNGHVHICQWLVMEKGVSVDVCTENDTTPLHLAIWTRKLETVQWLVEEGKCDVNKQNAHGCSAAHWAAFSGDVSVLRYLQSAGLDLYLINGNRRSALHKAAVKGHAEACRWLISPVHEGGGGLDESHMGPEKEGDHPWQLAASCGDVQLEAFLLEEYHRRTRQSTIASYPTDI